MKEFMRLVRSHTNRGGLKTLQMRLFRYIAPKELQSVLGMAGIFFQLAFKNQPTHDHYTLSPRKTVTPLGIYNVLPTAVVLINKKFV